MCSASQTAFSTVSDPLLESANLRKIQLFWQRAQVLTQKAQKVLTLRANYHVPKQIRIINAHPEQAIKLLLTNGSHGF
ncbi:hypothetical protein ccbrp13_34040 [Ktedonobacteria bacterium brp13]|nr:hypothetical protein ccbrp13_34040 [Ktedonobacteria bacterium brp13]